MNPLVIESRLVACLTPYFPSTLIYTGTGYEVQTPETLNMIVACDQVNHSGGNLYLAEPTITFISPALIGAVALDELETSISTLQDALIDPGFSDGWETSSPFFGGTYIQSSKTGQQGDMWTATVSLKLGISI